MYPKELSVQEDQGAEKAKEERKVEKEKNDALSLRRIEKFLSNSSTYLGALYLDSFKKMSIKAKIYSVIVFCDNHWFAIFSTPTTFEIFDSLGFLQKRKCINSIFMAFLKSQLGKKVLYANPQIQSNKSFACGYFAAFFIINREAGLSFNEILSKFSKNFRKNEHLAKLFLDNKLSSK